MAEIDNFITRASNATGLSPEKVREILKNRFKTFSANRENEYMNYLEEEALRINEAEIEKKRNLERYKSFQAPRPQPCPIVACDGIMISDPYWPWICSTGGLRHHLVYRAAILSGLLPERILERMT